MCAADDHRRTALFRGHVSLYADMAGHLTHGNVNPAVRNHPFSLLALRRRNAIQTFQPLFCVRAHCAKRRSVEIAHLIAAGNTACKRIFVHAAVQAQIHLLNSALNMRFCRRHGKCNRARLRHAQSRFHVLIDQLRQTLHRVLPFYADCTPDERPPQHTKQACRGERLCSMRPGRLIPCPCAGHGPQTREAPSHPQRRFGR